MGSFVWGPSAESTAEFTAFEGSWSEALPKRFGALAPSCLAAEKTPLRDVVRGTRTMMQSAQSNSERVG